jgi:hypothetical protein
LLVPVLQLSPTQYGVLAGLTVYAVPQVLAATLPIGALSNQVGAIVKPVRAHFMVRSRGVASSDKEHQIPNMFALTHLATDDGQAAPTNDWRRHKTTDEAEAAARIARAEAPRNRKFAAKTQRNQTEFRYGNRITSRNGNRIRKGQIPDTETVVLASNENRSTIYISGRGCTNGHDRDGEHEGEPSP